MGLFSIKPQSVNPAAQLLGDMDSPARKWNFDVEFLVETGIAKGETQKFHFFAISIDKPSYDFQYVDINQYGFKYKVLTGIQYGDLGIQFHDDNRGRVLSFIKDYLIRQVQGENKRHEQTNHIPIMNRQGLETAGVTARSGLGQTSIKQIKINQYAGIGPDGTGRGLVRVWTFEEPQIVNFDMDKASTDDDTLSGFVVKFNFKNVVIELDGSQYPDRVDDPLQGVADILGAFGTQDAILARNALQSALRISEEGIFSTGLLGSTPFDFLPQGQIARTGLGLIRKGSAATDALFPQDLKKLQNLNLNDRFSQIPTLPNIGTVAQAVPSAADQASKLGKIGSIVSF
jgi:hypothetical protein